MKAKKKQVKALRKRAPEVVEVYFDSELENIDEYIDDKVYEASPDSKLREKGIDFINTAFKELQMSGDYQDITLGRKDGKFIIFYSLESGESLEVMKEVFSKYPTECEIEYVEIDD